MQGSEYLNTLLVAVPRSSSKEWLKSYETLSQFVVPRSAKKLAEDSEFDLYAVTVFKKYANDFVHKCREMKFTPRDFIYDEEQLETDRRDFDVTSSSERKQWNDTIRLAHATFSDAFQCWMHLKALRVFVESVLRYGLPPVFMSCIIKPVPKQLKALGRLLNKNYGYLGGEGSLSKKGGKSSGADLEGEFAHLMLDTDYTPYVWFPINWA